MAPALQLGVKCLACFLPYCSAAIGDTDMIYIFLEDEIITLNSWPMNPTYPLGTWGVATSTFGGDLWYCVAKGTFERFWAISVNKFRVPPELQLKLLLLGDQA
jgi:hypothetical protein